jgi:hypothetical protein
LTLTGESSTLTPNGGLNANGLYNADAYLIAVDLSGTLTWQTTLGGEGGDILTTFDVASDGAIMLAGTSTSTYWDLDNDPSSAPELTGLNPEHKNRSYLMTVRRA